MALLLSKPTPVGVNAEYWRIGIANFHPRTATVQLVLDGYVSAAARDAGAQPLVQQPVDLPFSAELCDGGREGVYDAVKALPDWSAAVDC